ncbi:FAD-binding protein [Novosphingobium sp.]|uniref:FAD-binding protein n=1 Tax=Novosphingobium sp. TaxID=1874826 RepID=UPI0033412FB3
MTVHRPETTADLAALIAQASAKGARLELRGGGTKAAFGAPTDTPIALVDMRGFAGIVDYDPAELVLTVRPGTPLAEVEAVLAQQDQMLAFEPFDHGPIHGQPAGAATIGGVIASGVAGSRRVSRGGARDHLLGFQAVSGRGEAFVAGARVTKNVTGYDLPKLACGSWGRLFALTELHIKTLPRGETTLTVAIDGLSHRDAVQAMSRALGSQASVAAAAHQPGGAEPATTALRLEGFAPSVAARQTLLATVLRDLGLIRVMAPAQADQFWQAFRTLAVLQSAPVLWRVIVPPAQVAALIDALDAARARWLMDWAGGLVWVGADADALPPVRLRALATAAGGHAELVRAPSDLRRVVPARHPQPPALAALEARVRRAFDPAGVFETGRFQDQ